MEIDVKGCVCCGSDHQALTFEAFLTEPIELDGQIWTHTAECPETGRFLLVRLTSTDDPVIMGVSNVRD